MGRAGNKELDAAVLDRELIFRRRPVGAAAGPISDSLAPAAAVVPPLPLEGPRLAALEIAIQEAMVEAVGFDPVTPRTHMLNRFQKLQASKNALRLELEQSFGAYIDSSRMPGSGIVDEAMLDSFGLRLAAAHAFNGSVVEKTTFEQHFVAALNSAGHVAFKTPNRTHAGEDVVIDSVPYSLKTEGSRRAKPGQITISKLMEAAWCQGLTSRQQAVDIVPRVLEHLSRYKRILVLRNIDLSAYDDSIEPETMVRYSLVEIPHAVLEEMRNLKVRDFTSPRRTRKGSTTAHVRIDGEPAFALRFDGSQGKVTIDNLDIELCLIHAQWDVTHPDVMTQKIAAVGRPATTLDRVQNLPTQREALVAAMDHLPKLREDIASWKPNDQSELLTRLQGPLGGTVSLEDRLIGLLSDVPC